MVVGPVRFDPALAEANSIAQDDRHTCSIVDDYVWRRICYHHRERLVALPEEVGTNRHGKVDERLSRRNRKGLRPVHEIEAPVATAFARVTSSSPVPG